MAGRRRIGPAIRMLDITADRLGRDTRGIVAGLLDPAGLDDPLTRRDHHRARCHGDREPIVKGRRNPSARADAGVAQAESNRDCQPR